MAKQVAGKYTEKVLLHSDNGAEFYFRGRMFSESSHFDDESGTLTRLCLYETDNGEQVYSIVSGTGARKKRRHYIVVPEGDLYRISDGVHTMRLPLELLFAAAFGLCGIDIERAEEIKSAFEENLRIMAG